MTRLDRAAMHQALAECQDAEDYFRLLDVTFDQRVLDVNRLHILRAFADELKKLPDDDDSDSAALGRFRAALQQAYAAFTTSGALDHRVFKVLKERAPRNFVPLRAVSVEPLGTRR